MRKHYPLNSNGAEDAGQMPWKDGVPSTGVEGSYPGQALFTDTEAEILAAIDAAGLVRNGSDLTQLIQAASRGIWLGQFGGTSSALTAVIPNSVVLPTLLAGMRVRGIAASDYTGTGGTLAVAGIGAAGATVSYPIVGADGSASTSKSWKAGQFLTFDIDTAGNARFGSGSITGSFPAGSFVPLPGISVPTDTPYVDYAIPSGYDFFRLTGFLKGQVPNVNVLVSLDGSTFLSGTSNYNAGYGSTNTASTPFNTNPLYAAAGLNFGQICDLSLGFATVLSNFYRGSAANPVTMFGSSQGYQNGVGYSASSFMSNITQNGQAQKLRFYANGSNQYVRGGSYIGIEGFKYS